MSKVKVSPEKRREYDRAYAAKLRKEEEELDYKLAVLKARKEDENRAFRVATNGREHTVALLLHSYYRGMSRAKMEKIWGKQFVAAVLNQEHTKRAEAEAAAGGK